MLVVEAEALKHQHHQEQVEREAVVMVVQEQEVREL
jgi:hypothetical protein